MNYHILKSFTGENLEKLITFSQLEGPKTLLVDSDGGHVDIKDAVVHIINASDINVVVFGYCHSAAFEMLFELKTTPTILPNAYSAVHVSSWSIETRELRNTKDKSNFSLRESTKDQERQLSRYKKFLSEEQYKIVAEGGTIFLNAEQLKQIFK